MNEAILLIRQPNKAMYQTALEKIWDAFERTKSLENSDKRKSITCILDRVAGDNQTFRNVLEKEAQELTQIGNRDFAIRHSEPNRVQLTEFSHITYLFFRMAAFLSIIFEELNKTYASPCKPPQLSTTHK